MPLPDPDIWSDHLRQALGRFGEPLLRKVAGKLLRSRGQWPVEELIERAIGAVGNAAAVDRRLAVLSPWGHRLLALIGYSRQPRWRLGYLLEMLAALGSVEGTAPIAEVFGEGLLYPLLPGSGPRLASFEQWLGQGRGTEYTVFAHPAVTARAVGVDLGLPACPGAVASAIGVKEADGLEWPLRLAALEQQVAGAPLRLTQQGGFFKRDLERLRGDSILNASPTEATEKEAEAGLFAAALGRAEGILTEEGGELRAGSYPPAWELGLLPTLQSLWAALPLVETVPAAPETNGSPAANPYPAANLLAILLVGQLPAGEWVRPEAVEQWVLDHHPFWAGRAARQDNPVASFLLGPAFQLRLVQAAKGPSGEWLIRLSPSGKWILGMGEPPAAPADYPKTLLVQPNLEVVAYRQGLTPAVIASLSRFAAWKSLGPACTLQLTAETVYRALEKGESFEGLLRILDQYGTRETPHAVVETLRTWANKRERIGVYPSAALLRS